MRRIHMIRTHKHKLLFLFLLFTLFLGPISGPIFGSYAFADNHDKTDWRLDFNAYKSVRPLALPQSDPKSSSKNSSNDATRSFKSPFNLQIDPAFLRAKLSQFSGDSSAM